MNQDQKARLGGLFFVLAGAALTYLAIWRPYQAALRGEPTVSLNRTGIALGILLPLMGVLLATGGESVANHLKAQTNGKRTALGWVYIVVFGAIALSVYVVVEAKFTALGYTN